MIRRDKQPDVWHDSWLPLTDDITVQVLAEGQKMRVVVCDEPWLSELTGVGCISSSQAEQLHFNLQNAAQLEIYRLQTPSSPTISQTLLRVDMQSEARLQACVITLGGEHVRNSIEVRMHGQGAEVEIGGLYLMDRDQQCDNYVFVEHAAPNCNSTELYKGILDDAARGRFNGHVLVQEGACKTNANQTSRGILLTDKAHIDARPFLEIYNDDVKCSHGSTIGQLDADALFYMQTRGISQRTAMTMLSYAFCDEVVAMIGVEELRNTVADMVKKRLHGELTTSCDECAIKCSSPCNGADSNFVIDPSRL
ncbi:MAG: Fe-S cluster assembly protein SufD [Bacteroidales bacterium]|nr:Fe-S cluster assembly protein SufD [Bacteroidales bacterium]MBR1799828.1 Fe-S cluster assembly protein SufD [Bacteroidales bacterium]